jgi:PAS domain S-box-containing protein
MRPADSDPPHPSDASALQDNEARLRAILETAVEGILTIDEQGLIESINASAVQMFGYAPDEVIGRNGLRQPPHSNQLPNR